jgi:hypothetical protein
MEAKLWHIEKGTDSPSLSAPPMSKEFPLLDRELAVSKMAIG